MTPTAVTPSSFSDDSSIKDVLSDWTTASEVGLLGNAYQFADDNVISGHAYSYWVELVIFHRNQESDPLTFLMPYWIQLPLMPR